MVGAYLAKIYPLQNLAFPIKNIKIVQYNLLDHQVPRPALCGIGGSLPAGPGPDRGRGRQGPRLSRKERDGALGGQANYIELS